MSDSAVLTDHQYSFGRKAAHVEAVERCLAELNAFFELLESMNWIPRTPDQKSAVAVQMQKWKATRRAVKQLASMNFYEDAL